jgi:hypothetical protein
MEIDEQNSKHSYKFFTKFQPTCRLVEAPLIRPCSLASGPLQPQEGKMMEIDEENSKFSFFLA